MTGNPFSQFELFSGLNDRLLGEICESAAREVLPKGSALFQTGEPCQVIPIVVKGTIRVFATSPEGREITLYELASGESCVLSLNCALSGEVYTACAEVPEETIVFMLPVQAVRSWVQKDESFRRNLARIISRYLVHLTGLVEEVAFSNLDQRVAGWLLRQTGSGAGRHQVVKTTHEQLAAQLGLSREAVSRLLKGLEQQGALRLGRGRIEVCDRNALRLRCNKHENGAESP